MKYIAIIIAATLSFENVAHAQLSKEGELQAQMFCAAFSHQAEYIMNDRQRGVSFSKQLDKWRGKPEYHILFGTLEWAYEFPLVEYRYIQLVSKEFSAQIYRNCIGQIEDLTHKENAPGKLD